MRKVIGIGETTLDILFRNGKPTAAHPGGSTFNSMISLARSGINVCFVSETGNDQVGNLIRQTLTEENISTDYIGYLAEGGQTAVALAFLNDHSDAQYSFYKNYPSIRMDIDLPPIQANDIVILGSYYAICPALRNKISELLEKAHQVGAIIYYDLNFRANHKQEAIHLMPAIIENLENADIVRGSIDDFNCLYDLSDADRIYQEKIRFYSPTFICTSGADQIHLYTASAAKTYEVPSIQPVSTVGAGDNFNAGILMGLIQEGVRRDDLPNLSIEKWDTIVAQGMDFATRSCMTYDNYIPKTSL